MIAERYDSLDQLIKQRAQTHSQDPLLSYPSSDGKHFTDYTGTDVEFLTRAVASHYAAAVGFSHYTASSSSSTTNDNDVVGEVPRIALIGTSSIDYYITFLAVQRLGWTTILISPRLAMEGFAHLLTTTKCSAVIVAESSRNVLESVDQMYSLGLTRVSLVEISRIAAEDRVASASASSASWSSSSSIDRRPPLELREPGRDHEIVIHSGGTTGLPKPVCINPVTWLAQAADIAARMPRVDTLSTLPLFHSFGLATLLRCLINGKRLSLLDAGRPVTASIVESSLQLTHSRAVVTVPYVLKFFAEAEGGLQRLAQLDQVVAAGSTIPDDLAAELRKHQVHIFHLYGLTEAGALMEPTPDDFRWVTPLPHAKPFLQFDPVGDDGLYHLTVLPGLKAKAYSSSSDGSYATKDLFYRHPEDPNKWKFATRQDDIIVLINGEKADPIPIEDSVAHNPHVSVAVAFGAERDSLGLIVIASDSAAHLSAAEVLASIEPDLAAGNSRVPAYARISLEQVMVKPAGTPFPVTDKATVKRSLFLKQFAKDVEAHYTEMEGAKSLLVHEDVVMSDVEVGNLVRKIVCDVLGFKEAKSEEKTMHMDDMSDFFTLGMDSLKASQVRSKILRSIYLGGGGGGKNKLATNVVFEYPTAALLTEHLLNLRKGDVVVKDDAEEIARALVLKYSEFDTCDPATVAGTSSSRVVVRILSPSISPLAIHKRVFSLKGDLPLTVHQLLTGATGVVGVHILHHLLQNDTISKIYCLIRASDDAQALTRIHDTLHKHRLLKGQNSHLHQLLTQKLSAFSCDFNNVEENLSLQPETLHLFRSTITHIIHNAWSVNFNQSLRSFDRGCISSTHFLLNLAATSPTRLLLPPNNKHQQQQKQKPSLTFISSIATALAAPASVAEDLVPWSHVEERMGYAQSKWVAEQLLASAAAQAEIPVRIARLGQVCGDSVEGLWNPAEAIPTIVRTAVTQGVLPGEEEELQWLPADVAGQAIVDVAVYEDEDEDDDGEESRLLQVFNLVNSTFPLFWNQDFLPFLRRAGLSFEIISGKDWVKKLEKYSSSSTSIKDEPAVKLFDFFKHKYNASTTTNSQGKEKEKEEKERKQKNLPRFETARAKKISSAMAKNCVIDEILVAKFVKYWREECWK